MSTFVEKFKRELGTVIPITLFFFVAFQLLAVTEALILRKVGISTSAFLNAAVAALVVGKVVAVTDHLSLVNRFPSKPLIYNVVWKTLIYFAAWLVIRYVEKLFHFWRESGHLPTANRELMEGIVWPHFWAVQMWMFVLLAVLCAFRELVRALGRDRIVKMFFQAPDSGLPGQ